MMPESIWDKLLAIVLTYGLSGVINVVLVWVCYKLFSLLQAEQKAHRETSTTSAQNTTKLIETIDEFRDFLKERFPISGQR